MLSTIKKWGNSQGLRFSKEVLDTAGLAINEEVSVEVTDGQIIIRKLKPDVIHLRELFATYHTNDQNHELDWGKPQGEEIW